MSNEYWPINTPRNRYRRYRDECRTAVYCDHLHSIGLYPFVKYDSPVVKRELFMRGMNQWFKEIYGNKLNELYLFNFKLTKQFTTQI